MDAATADDKAHGQDKLFMENTLLRVSGALFCHDAKRAAKNTSIIELNRGVEEKHIAIRPDPELGQPGPLAHKIFVALLKKHSDYGRPVQKEISFTQRELGRLIGRKVWGARIASSSPAPCTKSTSRSSRRTSVTRRAASLSSPSISSQKF